MSALAPAGAAAGASPAAEPRFAHASEAEMARILDFYGVRWEYEPDTFPILWKLDGGVAESFSPDFYLPDLDQYLEMTTLRQKLVRKKNRKLRRLRELYPNLRVKLFYARDFRALMLKYGKVALADALSGTAGHVGPRVRPGAPTIAEIAEDGTAHAVVVADGEVVVGAVSGDPAPQVLGRRRRPRPAAVSAGAVPGHAGDALRPDR